MTGDQIVKTREDEQTDEWDEEPNPLQVEFRRTPIILEVREDFGLDVAVDSEIQVYSLR